METKQTFAQTDNHQLYIVQWSVYVKVNAYKKNLFDDAMIGASAITELWWLSLCSTPAWKQTQQENVKVQDNYLNSNDTIHQADWILILLVLRLLLISAMQWAFLTLHHSLVGYQTKSYNVIYTGTVCQYCMSYIHTCIVCHKYLYCMSADEAGTHYHYCLCMTRSDTMTRVNPRQQQNHHPAQSVSACTRGDSSPKILGEGRGHCPISPFIIESIFSFLWNQKKIRTSYRPTFEIYP